jgi:hypothetical protein
MPGQERSAAPAACQDRDRGASLARLRSMRLAAVVAITGELGCARGSSALRSRPRCTRTPHAGRSWPRAYARLHAQTYVKARREREV